MVALQWWPPIQMQLLGLKLWGARCTWSNLGKVVSSNFETFPVGFHICHLFKFLGIFFCKLVEAAPKKLIFSVSVGYFLLFHLKNNLETFLGVLSNSKLLNVEYVFSQTQCNVFLSKACLQNVHQTHFPVSSVWNFFTLKNSLLYFIHRINAMTAKLCWISHDLMNSLILDKPEWPS